ncbi:MAG: hypothetical protein QOD00_2837 [Blastocatellia bacterium]|jgi:hypothetical protein|nr:hypothetical protein [Blastocatellia bacterium]
MREASRAGRPFFWTSSLFLVLLVLSSAGAARAVPVVGVTISNKLVRFDTSAPGVITSVTNISGLQVGEQIQAIDFRAATATLYGVGSSNRLYLIDPSTGIATPVGAFTPFLNGTFFDADFNPVSDSLRVVSDARQNLLLNPDTAAAVAHPSLTYAAGDVNSALNPNIVGIAYTNNFGGAKTSTLYGIDWQLDTLVIQADATDDTGRLLTVASLGVDTTAHVGFDIAPGGGIAYASLTLQGDTVSRLFTINLTTGAATQVGTIGTVDFIRDIAIAPVGTFRFSAASITAAASISESAGKITLTVTRDGDTSGAATVDFATVDGTATQKGDYTIALGTLSFNAGETTKSFDIFIIDDAYVETDETFTVVLSNPTGGLFTGTGSSLTATIKDNDTAGTTNPIDNAQFFVRQQYLDFLNREPEAGGLAYWTNEITRCGADAACVNRRRVEVSAAFFLSNEFQETGYFVYRLYKAAFDGATGTRPTYLEFMHDRGRLLAGSNLDALKTALIAEFITRQEFINIYQNLTNAQFVDQLNANTGNSLTSAERNALVNGLNAFFPTETRASVLRKVVDNAVFKSKETNNAFVLMEYFGYLRRDIDTGGYAFWLNVLNRTGNFRGMVCAFITSAEYQDRFGPVRTRNDRICAGI